MRLALLVLAGAATLAAETAHSIAWFSYAADQPVRGRWGMHFDASYRLEPGAPWRQWLVRPGINFRLTERVSLQAAYSRFETRGAPGENRLHEQVMLTHPGRTFTLRHRWRLEHRFRNSDLEHRARYLLRGELPVYRREGSRIFLAVYDEPMVRFGGAGAAGLDQNRIYGGVGWQWSTTMTTEAGMFVQHLRLPSGRIERNNVYVLSVSSARPFAWLGHAD